MFRTNLEWLEATGENWKYNPPTNGIPSTLVERDLSTLLAQIHVLEEGTVRVVRLLLDRRAELEEFLWDGLVGSSEDVDKPRSES